jgi:Amt family ammonium transporter
MGRGRSASRSSMLLFLLVVFWSGGFVWAEQGSLPTQSTAATTAIAEHAPPQINPGDTAWLLISAAIVLMMTAPGLALFYGGMVRSKNALGTIMQSFIVLALISVQWVLWGYSLAFGPDKGGLIGGLEWFGLAGVGLDPYPDYVETVPHQAYMIYQGMFAVITAALITGTFAERMKFSSFLVFVLLWATFIYDPIAHWVWGVGGWIRQLGALDFAGGTVVHISSGVSALAAALVIGKRLGYGTDPMPPHNLPLTVLGASLLWVGWFGFNAGSALTAGALATSAFVVTNTAAAAAVLSWMFAEWIAKGKPTALGAASGAVAGLVAITPAAGFVSPISALVIGIGAGVFCYSACDLKTRLGYDDSLDVVGIHGIGGTWGALATGFFASTAINPAGADGLFFGNPELLKLQIIAVAATWAFAFFGTLLILVVLNAIMGLRVTEEEERTGLDLSQHRENAYVLGLPGHAGVLTTETFRPTPVHRPSTERVRPTLTSAPASTRQPPALTRQPESRRTPPVRLVETRGAPAAAGHSFTISVLDVDKKTLREIWHDLCGKYPHDVPKEFHDIYLDVISFRDNTWTFCKGNPEEYQRKLEQILYLYGVEGAHVQVA